MSGWKTWLGAIVMILTGAIAVLTGVVGAIVHFTDPTSGAALDLETAMNMVMGGLATIGTGIAAIGIAHKIEKNTQAVKNETAAIEAKK